MYGFYAPIFQHASSRLAFCRDVASSLTQKKTRTETRLNPVKAHMVRDYNPVKIRQSLHFIGLPHSFTVSYRGDAAVSSLKMKRNVVPPVRRSHDPFFFEPQAKWRSGPAREHPAVGVGLKNKNKRGEWRVDVEERRHKARVRRLSTRVGLEKITPCAHGRPVTILLMYEFFWYWPSGRTDSVTPNIPHRIKP